MVSGSMGTPTRYVNDDAGQFCRGLTCYDQAQPIACAAAVAVQKVIATESLLENGRQTGEYLAQLLRERLMSPGALARLFTLDLRGGGSFWIVEFGFTRLGGERIDLKGQLFAGLIKTRSLEKGLIVCTSRSGGNAQGIQEDEIIFAPAYNITREEVEKVVDIFVESVEDVLREHLAEHPLLEYAHLCT
jgi:adenosylmethionine-8-amino-7-oxononanoate aminotransferase